MGIAGKTKVGAGGRVVIPSGLRKEMGISIGDEVVMRLEKGELRLKSFKESVKSAQDSIKKYLGGKKRSLSDELIAQRRAEAKRE